MQLCKFMGVTPVEGFEVGERYEYYSAGVDAIRVCGNGMDKMFTVGGFNRSFTRISKSDTAKGTEGPFCKLGNPDAVHAYTTTFKADEVYRFEHLKDQNDVAVFGKGSTTYMSLESFAEDFTECNAVGEPIRFHENKVQPDVDLVNNPPHYKGSNGIEFIDVIENFGLGFNTGNAVKYILRAGRKDVAKHKEDLQKAIWYLNRELSYLD